MVEGRREVFADLDVVSACSFTLVSEYMPSKHRAKSLVLSSVRTSALVSYTAVYNTNYVDA